MPLSTHGYFGEPSNFAPLLCIVLFNAMNKTGQDRTDRTIMMYKAEPDETEFAIAGRISKGKGQDRTRQDLSESCKTG